MILRQRFGASRRAELAYVIMRSKAAKIATILAVMTLGMGTSSAFANAGPSPHAKTVVRSPCDDRVHVATLLSGVFRQSDRRGLTKGQVVITDTQTFQKLKYKIHYRSEPNEQIGKTVVANAQYPGPSNWLYINGTANFDDEGNYTGATGSVTDICTAFGEYG